MGVIKGTLVKSMFQNDVRIHFLVLAAMFFVTFGFTSQVFGAKPTFTSYNLESKYEEVRYFDFSGDGLDDILVINEPNLVFFFQDSARGFSGNPDLVYSLGDNPSVIWPARPGNSPGQNN